MFWVYRRSNKMLFITHHSCYSACFRRHRGSAPLSEVGQKLSPPCILASWLEPRFEQCRNTVKMKAWFLHPACHSELPTLAGRGFIPSAFPWYQHLCIQLCSILNWLAYALALHRPLAQQPLALHPCKHASCSRIPGHGPKLTDGHRQSKQRAWRPQKQAPMPEGKGGHRRMGKQWVSSRRCTLTAILHRMDGVWPPRSFDPVVLAEFCFEPRTQKETCTTMTSKLI